MQLFQNEGQAVDVLGLTGLGEAGDGVVDGYKVEGERKQGEVLREQECGHIQSLTLLVGTAR